MIDGPQRVRCPNCIGGARLEAAAIVRYKECHTCPFAGQPVKTEAENESRNLASEARKDLPLEDWESMNPPVPAETPGEPFESEAGRLLVMTAQALGASFSSSPLKSSVCAVPEHRRIDPSVAGVLPVPPPSPSSPRSPRPDLVKFLQERFRLTDHAVALAAGYIQHLLLKPLRERIEYEGKTRNERVHGLDDGYISGLAKALRIIEEGK